MLYFLYLLSSPYPPVPIFLLFFSFYPSVNICFRLYQLLLSFSTSMFTLAIFSLCIYAFVYASMCLSISLILLHPLLSTFSIMSIHLYPLIVFLFIYFDFYLSIFYTPIRVFQSLIIYIFLFSLSYPLFS